MRTLAHRESSGRLFRALDHPALRGFSFCLQGFLPALAWFGSVAPAAYGQVDPVELRTGSGQIVATELRAVSSGSSVAALPLLRFEFGFATEEVLKPQSFADSLTVSLENSLGQRVYIATSSVSGTAWAPFVPGAIPLSSDLIHSVTVAYAVNTHPTARTESYSVEVPVPPSWISQEIRVRFDLFDNLDDRASAGYFRRAELVPEPGVLALLGTALILAGTAVALGQRRLP